MNTALWQKIETICLEASQLKEKDQKDFLQNACGHDRELFHEVTSLLHHQDDGWLNAPLTQLDSSFFESEDAAISSTRIGPYRLIRNIASGGMGSVYLATRSDEHFKQFVALKLVHRGLTSPEALHRFKDERQIMASLNHPHIARLYDGGATDDGLPWLAMEFVDGVSITQYCKQHGFSIEEKLKIFRQVCTAVQYAHQNLVIHRDLKPANILITGEGTPKLLDFGIAQFMDLDYSKENAKGPEQLMTPEYTAPELLGGGAVSTAIDVYALGVLLYEMLTDTLPYHFTERNPENVKAAINRQQAPAPSRVNQSSGKDLDQIVLKAICKEPSGRYNSVDQFSNDLYRYTRSLPVMAVKHSPGYLFNKFVSRNKWSVAAASLVLLVVMTFTGITWFQSRKIKAQSVKVAKERDRAEAVSQFLVDLFKSTNPSEAKNASLTAVELLEVGAKRIETQLADQQELQADLYLQVAEVYESLGRFPEALKYAQRAHQIHMTLYPDNHPEKAKGLNTIGWIYRQMDAFIKADSFITAGLSMRRALFGKTHLSIVQSLNDLAVLKQSQGNLDTTRTLLMEAIQIREKLGGEPKQIDGVVLSNFGALLYSQGDIAGAEKYMREAVGVFKITSGRLHMKTANALTNLAAILTAQKKFDEAAPFYRDALDIRIKILGEEHPHVAGSYGHLGNLLRLKKQYPEAEQLLLRSLQLRKHFLGQEHILVGVSMRTLAQLYTEMGNVATAEKYLLSTLNIYRKAYAEDHANTAIIEHLLGNLYYRQKKYRKAETHYREALRIGEQVLGANNVITAKYRMSLGLCLAKAGEDKQARAALEQALKVSENATHTSDTLYSFAREMLEELRDVN